VKLLNRVCDIASDVDGVTVWEAFVEDGGTFMYLNERFSSEQAFLEYESAVGAEGLRPRIAEALELQHLVLPSAVEDDRLRAELDPMGAIKVQQLASK
jgi:hypothetical protein